MKIEDTNWQSLRSLDIFNLKGAVFDLIQDATNRYHEGETDNPAVLEVVPRLSDLFDRRPELNSYRELLSALARSIGLWNYIDKDAADERDLLLAESVTSQALDGITFHREQISALNVLLAGRNLILSAPTSFGKSLLIDALLASAKFKRVAIVLPTIALLDEFRRRLARRFDSKFKIVMYHSEVAVDENVIFLGTQERLINRPDLGKLDLVVVDEFYKLDPSRQDERSLTLNAAVYQLLKRARQFFFLGPNISGVRFSSDSQWRFEFISTRFSTVAVDTFDLRSVEDKFGRLVSELKRSENWPALVFVSSPDKANTLADQLKDDLEFEGAAEFADWIDENVGEGWTIGDCVRTGVGLHHGRIPRALASRMVRLFNRGEIAVLLCTSTLIEGVNTAAKSVLIYDKQINRRDYDFFTYSNIKGRAGRLGEHQVGSVYLFHAPPQETIVEVEPPLFGDMNDAPDELVVHLSEEDADEQVKDRVQELSSKLNLDPSELRLASTIGIEDAVAIKQLVSRKKYAVNWYGYPGFSEILAVCELILRIRKPSEFGVRSSRQLAYMLVDLRRSTTIRAFFLKYSASYRGLAKNQDEVFRFLRACEYGLPQLFGVVELFAKRDDAKTNYSLFLQELPRWFRAEVLKNLDEQGIPIQIAERFYENEDSLEDLKAKLIAHARLPSEQLTSFEKQWVVDALGKD